MKHLIKALLLSSAMLLAAEVAVASAEPGALVVAKAEPAAKKKTKTKAKPKAKAKSTAKKAKKAKPAETIAADDAPAGRSGGSSASMFAFAAAFFASGAVAYAAKFTNPPPGKQSDDQGRGDKPAKSRAASKQHSILDAA